MAQEETKDQGNIQQNEMVVNSQIKSDLTEIRKWTMFFTVLGFIGIGLMAIAALGMLIAAIVGAGFMNNQRAGIMGLLTLVYLVLGILYFFPVFYLLKFSTNMKSAIEKTEQNQLTSAFAYLKSHYKFVGILTIVFVGLYILLGIIAMIVGVSSLF